MSTRKTRATTAKDVLMDPRGSRLEAVAAVVINTTATAVCRKLRASDLEKPGCASMQQVTTKVESARRQLLYVGKNFMPGLCTPLTAHCLKVLTPTAYCLSLTPPSTYKH